MQLSTRARSRTWPATLALIAALAAVPFLPLPDRLQFVLAIAMISATAAVGLDLFSGYGGQLMFGSFGFVGIGGYTSAILGSDHGWSVWATLPAAVVVCGLVALVIGAAMVRLPDLGTAMGTFFFAFVVMVLLRGRLLAPLTHGSNGIPVEELTFAGISLGSGPGLYWLAFSCLVGVTGLSYRYANSRAGRVLRLIKRSGFVASAMGVDVFAHKLAAFVFAAMAAGTAGFVYAQALGFLAPENFGGFESVNVLTMAIIGGLGSVAGPILGALVFSILGELSRAAASDREIIFAIPLLAALIFFPGGIYSGIERLVATAAGRAPSSRRGAVPRLSSPATGAGFGSAPAEREPDPGASPTQDDLVLSGVTVAYGGVKAVDGVSIAVRQHEIHAIMGPNGAGKTTLLNCISGAQTHRGEICLGGELLSGRGARNVRLLGVSRTFQNPSLVPDLDALENVEIGTYGSEPSSPFGDVLPTRRVFARDRRSREAAAAALDLVGFPVERRRIAAADLTLAEQKIVDIARAAVGARRLLLLDEPTAGLSESEIGEIARVLRIARDRTGLTIVVIAHHIGFIREVADTATVLDFGVVLAEGCPDQVTSRADVTAVFLGEAHA